jgi:hypothetical protein
VWTTHVDPNQLENALLNLAVNARDAMPGGGQLTIETANADLDAAAARALNSDIEPGQYVTIAVADTGTGMTEEVLSRAFEPFFTTKGDGRGTGLGLSQVFGFIKQSGGHVKLATEAGRGTMVTLYLPRGIADPPQRADQAAQLHKPHAQVGHGETVLLVEDDAQVRGYTTEAIAELGFRVLVASGAEAALRILEDRPEIALLFTDIGLPGLDGRQLAEEAVRRRPGLKVVFTTGYTDNGDP